MQTRTAEHDLVGAVVGAWNGARTARALEPIKSCGVYRPPHSASGLGNSFALGPDAEARVGSVLAKLTIFQPDPHGDRLLKYRGRDGFQLKKVGQQVVAAFVDKFFDIYPWGVAGVWLADMAGSTQSFALRSAEVASIEELFEGSLEPNLVRIARTSHVA